MGQEYLLGKGIYYALSLLGFAPQGVLASTAIEILSPLILTKAKNIGFGSNL